MLKKKKDKNKKKSIINQSSKLRNEMKLIEMYSLKVMFTSCDALTQ